MHRYFHHGSPQGDALPKVLNSLHFGVATSHVLVEQWEQCTSKMFSALSAQQSADEWVETIKSVWYDRLHHADMVCRQSSNRAGSQAQVAKWVVYMPSECMQVNPCTPAGFCAFVFHLGSCIPEIIVQRCNWPGAHSHPWSWSWNCTLHNGSKAYSRMHATCNLIAEYCFYCGWQCHCWVQYPATATQWHPEKNVFEWATHLHVPHSYEAVCPMTLSQSAFLVWLACFKMTLDWSTMFFDNAIT